MARKKVRLAFIENERARKTTYNKRKNGLMKKAHELNTLCEVPICAIINSQFEPSPVFWPNRETVTEVVSKWREMPSRDRNKKMVNQETFLRERVKKVTESRDKLKKENKDWEMTDFMFNCMSEKVSVTSIQTDDDNQAFGRVLQRYLKDINHHLKNLKMKEEGSSSQLVSAAGATASSSVMSTLEMGSSSNGLYDMTQHQVQNSFDKNFDLNKKE